ncbi:hypothetical protein [Georgenia muralis]
MAVDDGVGEVDADVVHLLRRGDAGLDADVLLAQVERLAQRGSDPRGELGALRGDGGDTDGDHAGSWGSERRARADPPPRC